MKFKLVIVAFFAIICLCSCEYDLDLLEEAEISRTLKVIQNTNCPQLPCDVTFEAQSKENNSYEWNFGDGQSSSSSSQIHSYLDHGKFEVSLQVSNNSASFDTNFVLEIISETFTRNLGTGFGPIEDIINLSDDNYAMMGSKIVNNNSLITLLLIDNLGNPLPNYPVIYDGNGDNFAFNIHQDAEDNLVFTGLANNEDTFGRNEVLILKTNIDGQPLPLYPKFHSVRGWGVATHSFLGSGGDIVFTGIGDVESRKVGFVVGKTDTDGTMRTGFPGFFPAITENAGRLGQAIIEHTDGSIFVTGWIPFEESGLELVKVNPDGTMNSEYPKKYSAFGGDIVRIADIIEHDDGDIILVGRSTQKTNAIERLVIFKININGVLVENYPKVVEGPSNEDIGGRRVAQSISGNIMVLGESGDQDIMLIGINPISTEILSGLPKFFDQLCDGFRSGITRTDDGGFFIYCYSNTDDLVLIKTDSRGIIWD